MLGFLTLIMMVCIAVCIVALLCGGIAGLLALDWVAVICCAPVVVIYLIVWAVRKDGKHDK